MRYFDLHEDVYARRLAQSAEGWDDGAYDDFAMRDLVSSWLATSRASQPDARVLELGCGTGALSCLLAERGFQVTGVDISPSAISFARSVACQRGLQIHFEVADVCSWQAPADGFNVILDAHLLHCISLPPDRRHVLARISQALAPDGEFWTETMVLAEGFQASPSQRLDPTGILWSVLADPNPCTDAVREGDNSWIPTRYIALSPEAILEEFEAAGFHAIEWNLAPPDLPGEPASFQARLHGGSGPR